MKTLIATLLLGLTTSALAQPVYLNIPGIDSAHPGLTIPTASHEECEKLMIKLSREDNSNFYLSCSIVPQTL
jgi:hypothetical protein